MQKDGTSSMSTQDNHSEIARLRQRIAEEYEATMRGSTGFASDSAEHQLVTKPVEQIGTCLRERVLAETLEAL